MNFSHEISNAEAALIGHVIISFSAFENEILRTIAAMNGAYDAPASADTGFHKRFQKIVEGGFGKRVKSFVAEYRKIYDDDEFISEFENEMKVAISIRDQVAHGVWGKAEGGGLVCVFFSREAIKKGFGWSEMEFTRDGLECLAALNTKNAEMLASRFGEGDAV